MGEFSRGVRTFWFEVARFKFGEINGKPVEVLLVYNEKKGWHLTGFPADELHHAIPASLAEANGQLGNEQVGIPVSRRSHRGERRLPFEEDYSFHPDMNDASKSYRNGDKQAFEKCRIRHQAEARLGNYPPGFSPELAMELEEIMRSAALEYMAATGKRKPISGKERPRKKHWADGLF